ncbi:uncharacterized protein PFL1_03531 [Pseudozyma flocculosa PF-1]|uniref:Tethering factor for nuclear proteasome STS1 n=2 Tax=Pseudozyma flocculosa TaxID=84751 RepID=A0A5C3F839_9BASI|nr:uncharacterized protein PFL1_03531 [Pseudozyma flocculosa PF-1]EPQ28727.1 hypothetical protein PFL1_03531 [Pseudozyma flocculosa PF-1]SPO39501.1 uncharacterized protein PSFLO_04982 [Pseudozyma flocculosa]
MPYPSYQSSPLLLHHPPALANNANGHTAFQMPSTPSRSASPAYASAGAAAAAASASPGPAHQIPFNATPVHHAPSPLGFGFGFGSSFGGNNNQAPLATPSHSSFAATSALAHSFASPSASPAYSPRRADTKRRRDSDHDDADEADEDMDQHSSSPRMRPAPGIGDSTFAAAPRSMLAPKRLRAGISQGSPSSTHLGAASSGLNRSIWGHPAESSSSHRSSSSPGKGRMSGLDVDLGKMLASVDKASLLSMLMNLLAQSKDPNLGAQILSLLPTPSLETVEAALDEAEKNVRAAIPYTQGGDAAGVRDEYTWSRVRGPLAAFSDAALSYLPFFVSELDAKRGGAGGSGSGADEAVAKREEVHPATTFTFLHALTLRVLRLHALLPPVPKSSLAFSALRLDRAPSTSFGFGFGSAAASGSMGGGGGGSHSTVAGSSRGGESKHSNLAERIPEAYTSLVSPDALLSTLMPALLKQWTILVERLDRAVNVEGRMFGQEVVLGWARALDTVNTQASSGEAGAKPEDAIIRKAMDEVRNRLERDLGWLVGGGPGPATLRSATPVARPVASAGSTRAVNSTHGDGSQQQQRQHLVRSAPAATLSGHIPKRSRGSSMDDDEEEL